MTIPEMSWQDAIATVLQDSGEPLNYQRITTLIDERQLRSLSGSTPVATVRGQLSQMTTEGTRLYDPRIQRFARGIYVFVDPSDPDDTQEELQDFDDAIDESTEKGARITGVPAFGLYWEKEKVNWGRGTSGILGRQTSGSQQVDFSEQHGVYILHKDRSVVYVGRTTDSLRGRLDWHNKDKKAPRWNQFSWFGFRDVNETTGKLEPLPSEMETRHLVTIIESVLIEALEPPVNGRRGDYMGVLYEQVPDPMIQEQEDTRLRRMMADSLHRR